MMVGDRGFPQNALAELRSRLESSEKELEAAEKRVAALFAARREKNTRLQDAIRRLESAVVDLQSDTIAAIVDEIEKSLSMSLSIVPEHNVGDNDDIGTDSVERPAPSSYIVDEELLKTAIAPVQLLESGKPAVFLNDRLEIVSVYLLERSSVPLKIASMPALFDELGFESHSAGVQEYLKKIFKKSEHIIHVSRKDGWWVRGRALPGNGPSTRNARKARSGAAVLRKRSKSAIS
jgi:hypothetical protein